MQRSPSSLNARLADGLDLHSQIKVAHWNIKGPQLRRPSTRCSRPSPLGLAVHNDALAERAVTLGAQVYGTARHGGQGLDASRSTRRRPGRTSST